MNRASSVVGREETLSVNGSAGFDFLDLGLRATCFDGDLDSIFHRIFEGHLDSEEVVSKSVEIDERGGILHK